MNSSTFYIYNASAGSGKTYSLVRSYLKLLLCLNNPEAFRNILAITFTNKAVTEMKERIIDALKKFSNPKIINSNDSMFIQLIEELNMDPKALHTKSKKVLYSILKNYAAFEVSTIDKFTQKIIRTFAFDLKLPLNFEVELDTESILHRAVDNLISRAGSNSELTQILIEFAIEKTDDDLSWDVAYDFNKISKLLTKENDIPFLAALNHKTLNDFKTLKIHLKSRLTLIEASIREISNKTLDLILDSGLNHSDFSRKTLPNHFLRASNLDLVRLYDNQLESKLAARKNIYNKSLDKKLKEIINGILTELESNYLTLKKYVYQHRFIANIYKNITPLSVIHLINQELSLLKIEENKLLISEFNSIVSNQVKNQPVPFIYERIGEKFKHYFIDEFQDTSKMQWDNLIPLINNALSGEDASAMLVGDAKQAIYRWRGGEATQFINLFNKNENPFAIEAQIKSLGINYRSTEAIIKFNNSFFEHVASYVFKYETHQDLYLKSKQKTYSTRKGYVNISFANILKDDDRHKIFPEQVHNKIMSCIDAGYAYKDLCVLVRKSKEGIAIANYLSDKDIDIISSETLALQRSTEVNFIIATLSYLINPNNNVFKIEMLTYIAKHLNIINKHVFYSNYIKLASDDLFKALNIYGILFNPTDAVQLPVYELIETIIYSFKLNKQSNAYIQFLLDFVFTFSKQYSSNISDFLSHFEEKKQTLKIASPDGKNAVKIMTIHKSKGLEFPVVIFPYADLNIYQEKDAKIWFDIDKEQFNDFSHALLNYNKDINEFGHQGREIHNSHQAELELDNINLLYVALTRAAEQLYIISTVRFDNKGSVKINNGQYSGLLINYLKHIGKWDDNQLDYSFGEIERAERKETLIQKSISQKKFISIPKKEHNINILTKSGLLWDTKQKEAIEKGNLIHEIMAKIKTYKDIELVLSSLLASGIINYKQNNDLKKIVNSIVLHAKLRVYFSQDYLSYNEREIVTNMGAILRPDRLTFIDSNKVVIIDYKSGKPKIEDQEQLFTYQNALEEMNFLVIKKILVYINKSLEIKEI